MIITNPRSQQYPQLQSYVTSDYREYAQPKMTQTHSDRVMIVISADQDIGEADGMVTSLYNIELHVRVADCGNIYCYDPVWGVIGVCHSGWKWAHMNIIKNTINAMISLWSVPQNIFIRTGPCISWKNYQFWPEVKELFDEKYSFQTSQWYYLDVSKLHRDQLLWAWILAEHIIQSDICTFDTLELPSYRRQWPDSGRITWSIMQIE